MDVIKAALFCLFLFRWVQTNDPVTNICQAADKQLFTLVEWAKRIPHFSELPLDDQVILLRAGTHTHTHTHTRSGMDVFEPNPPIQNTHVHTQTHTTVTHEYLCEETVTFSSTTHVHKDARIPNTQAGKHKHTHTTTLRMYLNLHRPLWLVVSVIEQVFFSAASLLPPGGEICLMQDLLTKWRHPIIALMHLYKNRYVKTETSD